MTQKTAMQELIAYIDHMVKNECKTFQDTLFFNAILAIIESKELLATERTQIKQAYDKGYSCGTFENGFDTGLDYFTKTYEQ